MVDTYLSQKQESGRDKKESAEAVFDLSLVGFGF